MSDQEPLIERYARIGFKPCEFEPDKCERCKQVRPLWFGDCDYWDSREGHHLCGECLDERIAANEAHMLEIDENPPTFAIVEDGRKPTLLVLTWVIVLGTFICMILIYASLISYFSPRLTPMFNITTEQAEAYKSDKGHYPLIVGEEYLYMSNFVELIEASSDHNSVIVRNRFGDRATIHIDDLEWKSPKKPR